MRSGTIAFLLGVLAVCSLSALPPWPWLLALTVAAVGLWRVRGARLLLWCVAGVLWACWRAEWTLATALPAEAAGQTVVLTGVVASLPERRGRDARFEFDVQSLQLGRRALPRPGRVLLGWPRDAPPLWPGERWQLAARLKPPSGFANPGGFDYEGWLFQRGLRATGHVVPGWFTHRLEGARGHRVERLRAGLRERILGHVGGLPGTGVVVALAIGADEGLTPAEWRVFNRTGTTHLVSISGLHVTLIAAAVFWLARRAWALTVLGPRWLAAPRAAAGASFLAAALYSALAGFSVPTQRTLIMLGVALWGVATARRLAVSRLLALALLLVLVHDPFAVLGTGLWLSFGAVAGLLYVTVGRRGPVPRWRQALWVQLAAAVVMTPLLLWFFARNPLVSPLANLLAVPWVSVLVTPLALVGAALTLLEAPLAGLVLSMAVRALELLWPVLEWLAALPAGQWSRPLPAPWALLATCVGTAVLLLPRGAPARWVALVWLLPLGFYPLQRPPEGQFRFTLLDVGQGLAAVVETRRHVLVFDTGPRLGPTLDTGRAVVAPFLRAQGWSSVDRVLISHGDADHAGGLPGLAEEVELRRTFAPPGQRLALPRVEPCEHGERWTWDGVPFLVLRAAVTGGDNDASCLLRVGQGEAAVLMTGDVEAPAERWLVEQAGAALRAGALVVPHHGSRTSSSPAFLRSVSPRLALVSAGYRNRFGFPHPQVVARYRAVGARVLDTAAEGALTVESTAAGLGPVRAHRRATARFWKRP